MQARQELTGKRIFINIFKVIGFIILSSLPITFSFFMNAAQEFTPTPVRWGLAIAWILFTGFLIRWMWRYYLRLYPDSMPKMRAKDIWIAIGLFVFLRIVAVGGTLLNEAVYGNVMTSNDELIFAEGSIAVIPIYFFIFNLTLGIFAPILEELAFRGIFTHLLFRENAVVLPAIIISAIFSLMHGMDNIITFSMYFIMGLTFFFAYRRRMAIKDAIWLHILNNSLAMIMSIVLYVLEWF